MATNHALSPSWEINGCSLFLLTFMSPIKRNNPGESQIDCRWNTGHVIINNSQFLVFLYSYIQTSVQPANEYINTILHFCLHRTSFISFWDEMESSHSVSKHPWDKQNNDNNEKNKMKLEQFMNEWVSPHSTEFHQLEMLTQHCDAQSLFWSWQQKSKWFVQNNVVWGGCRTLPFEFSSVDAFKEQLPI